jgi:hypothetical protein
MQEHDKVPERICKIYERSLQESQENLGRYKLARVLQDSLENYARFMGGLNKICERILQDY